MMRFTSRVLMGLFFMTFAFHPETAFTDEGMWLFNNPPTQALKERHGFEPTAPWLEHLRKASVRFNSGGSGSFVSANGLVMTNHHVGADALQKMSGAERDLIKSGFSAKTPADEIKCVDLELNVLMNIEDVTEQMNAAVKPDMTPEAAQKARRAVKNTLEKERLDKTGLRSDVVTLYQGGQYHLYQFKKYTDVRLVFAPEKDIAFFGGDPDNFEFPRYDLDVCFFRVYEDNKPAKIEHFLTWSKAGAQEGELIFVSGHPGRTNRLNTVAHLEFLRDVMMPLSLNVIRRREVMLRAYADRGLENARRAQDELFGYQNSRKARLGGLAGLHDPALIAEKARAEKTLREAVAKDAKLAADCSGAWEAISDSLKVAREHNAEQYILERGQGFNSELFHIARTLVRLADESEKPNAERLPEFSEAGLESLKQQLFSEAPIYPDLEILKLNDSLGMMIEMLGSSHEVTQKVLAGKSPAERAAELVSQSKLADVAVRKALADGKKPAISASTDPFIQLARAVDEPARAVRKIFEEKIDEVQRQAYAKIARAKFAIHGASQYPDATFTLRLAYGLVKGYEENGQHVPAFTTVGGTFVHAEKHGNKDPFALPKSWLDRKEKLDGATPFNFVSTADIIGGNSGSPVVNRAGELVGIIFDGNIQSLVLDYAFSEKQARAVSVDSRGILECLQKIYDAQALVAELTASQPK